MLHAITFDDVLRRAPAWGTAEDPLGSRLISIVFANPSSPIWSDVAENRAFLDARTGDKWDLFFAGMSCYSAEEPNAIPLSRAANFARYLNPQSFTRIETVIYEGQRAQLRNRSGSVKRWKYSGGTDLVSFMCYAQEPDWLSLRAVRLVTPEAAPIPLGEVAEGLKDWRDGTVAEALAPGSFEGRHFRTLPSLEAALTWSASAIVGGMLGNAAFELLKRAAGG